MKVDRDAHVVKFLKMIEAQKPKSIQHAFDQVAVVLRTKSSPEGDMKKFVLDWSTFRQKILAHDVKPGTMLQEMIHAPSGKPSVVRLTYYVSTKAARGNFAYLLSSTVHTDSHAGLLHKTVTDSSLNHGIEIFRQTGQSLRPYEHQARLLVDFLQRGYRIRIDEIVLDFLRSKDGRVWLCGCKGFRLDPATLSLDTDVYRITDEQPRSSFVTCKLCRLQYGNGELPHLVSLKMLYVFQMHVRRRRELPFEASHLRTVSPDLMSQSVRICAWCFLVITAEHNLHQTEIHLARVMSIPLHPEDIFLTPGYDEERQFLPKELTQYRVLIQFMHVESKREVLGGGYLHFQLGTAKASYALEKPQEKERSVVYPVQALRLLYVFAQTEKQIKGFLKQVKAQIVVTDSSKPGLGKTIASTTSPILHSFSTSTSASSLFSHLTLSLFNPTRKIRYPLELGLGFSCDHPLSTDRILTSLSRVCDAFMPVDPYFNTDPLPESWMEAFGHITGNDSFGPEERLEDAYSPLIQPGDTVKMQDFASPFPSPLPSRRPSKTVRSQSVSQLKSALFPLFTTFQSPIQSSDVSRTEWKTDPKVLEVAEMVDEFLSNKQEKAVVVPELDIAGKVGKRGETGKRRGDKVSTARISSRLHSGRSSTRSISPHNLPTVLTTRLSAILPLSTLHY